MEDHSRGDPPIDEEPPEGGGVIDGECVLVPEGRYELRYLDYDTGIYFGVPKVRVNFAIIDPEDYAGSPVEKFYNAKELTGPPGRFGNFKARRRGDLIRDYHRLVGRNGRRDRISFRSLKDKRVIGEIETVTVDYQRDPLPEDEQYSRVKKLIGVLPSDDW